LDKSEVEPQNIYVRNAEDPERALLVLVDDLLEGLN
jgi:hypothetical protein